MTSAETTKLAHLLDTDPERFAALDAVPVEDLRVLHEQVTEALFAADRDRFAGIAKLTGMIPVPIAAKVARLALPPRIAARASELLDPARANELAGRLPVGYLADVATCMDPRRGREVVAGLDVARVAEVTAELAARREFVPMGSFVGHLPPDALRAAVGVLDGEALLRVGFLTAETERFPEWVGYYSAEQRAQVVAAAKELGLTAELAHLLDHITPEQRSQF